MAVQKHSPILSKRIFIIRHAKSSWKNADSRLDIDRVLNTRGYNDAYKMAKFLKTKNIHFHYFISSDAIRALHTATIFCKVLSFDYDFLKINSKLYHPAVKDIIEVLCQLDEKMQNIAIFSHNPAINDFIAPLNTGIENVVTCGIVELKFSGEWQDIDAANLEFINYDFPKKLI